MAQPFKMSILFYASPCPSSHDSSGKNLNKNLNERTIKKNKSIDGKAQMGLLTVGDAFLLPFQHLIEGYKDVLYKRRRKNHFLFVWKTNSAHNAL